MEIHSKKITNIVASQKYRPAVLVPPESLLEMQCQAHPSSTKSEFACKEIPIVCHCMSMKEASSFKYQRQIHLCNFIYYYIPKTTTLLERNISRFRIHISE